MRRRRSSEAVNAKSNRGDGHRPCVGLEIRGGADVATDYDDDDDVVRGGAAGENKATNNDGGGGGGSSPSSGAASPASMTPRSHSNGRAGAGPSRCRHYRRFYFLHSALVLAVLILGMMHNGGDRKYIPVEPEELSKMISSQTNFTNDLGSCSKAYVNAHSSSMEEDLAAIFCCPGTDYDGSSLEGRERSYRANLCHPRLPVVGISTQRLPFARRLTRLVEAWLLPLLPIFIRLAYQLVTFALSWMSRYRDNQNGGNVIQREETSMSNFSRTSSSLSSDTSAALLEKTAADPIPPTTARPPSHKLIRTTLKRLLFYFALLNFRGWVLYVGANSLEDYLILPWFTGNTVVSPMRTNSMSDVEHDLSYGGGEEPECWYKDALKSHHKSAMENDGHSDCYGRPFDFSDHVVLFLAHYLPIIVMEMLLCYSLPFWDTSAKKKSASKLSGAIWNAVQGFLFLYLHLIVLGALYHTAAYFHTPDEILVGYGVSLIMQLPLAYLMCCNGLQTVRKHLGLPSEGVTSEKGD